MSTIKVIGDNDFFHICTELLDKGLKFTDHPDSLTEYLRKRDNFEPIMDFASERGYIDLLDWAKKYGFIYYSYEAIEKAANNYQMGVLDWWENSSLQLNLDLQELFLNSRIGDNWEKKTQVMEWLARVAKGHSAEKHVQNEISEVWYRYKTESEE